MKPIYPLFSYLYALSSKPTLQQKSFFVQKVENMDFWHGVSSFNITYAIYSYPIDQKKFYFH